MRFSLFLGREGFRLLRRAIDHLVDAASHQKVLDDLREYILEDLAALAYHDFQVRKVGDMLPNPLPPAPPSEYTVHMDMYSILSVSNADRRPMYLQIMEQITHLVAVGDWAPGQEIPSIRGLAVELKVSVITVKRAYRELEHQGVIVTRQGRGTFVADDAGLGTSLKEQELDQHLSAAIETGRLLGLDAPALEARLRDLLREMENNREKNDS